MIWHFWQELSVYKFNYRLFHAISNHQIQSSPIPINKSKSYWLTVYELQFSLLFSDISRLRYEPSCLIFHDLDYSANQSMMRIPAIDTIFQSQVRTRRITVYKSHTGHHVIRWNESCSCFNKYTHYKSKKYYTKHFWSLILVLILHVVLFLE